MERERENLCHEKVTVEYGLILQHFEIFYVVDILTT